MKNNGLFTGLVMVVVFAAGILLGYYFGTTGGGADEPVENNGSVAKSVPPEGIKINASTLTEAQKKMLGAVGIDAENLTITPEMVACAEAKIGSARLAEIQGGGSPSMTESTSLAACYK